MKHQRLIAFLWMLTASFFVSMCPGRAWNLSIHGPKHQIDISSSQHHDSVITSSNASHEIDVDVNGDDRHYLVHLPDKNSDQKRALVLVLHGALGNAYSVQFDSRMTRKADECGFVVAYPDGSNGLGHGHALLTWNAGNCCGPACANNAEDVQFLRQVILDAEERFNIDKNRVYITGLSNGAMMAFRAGAELSDLVAAIAPVDGCMMSEVLPTSPVSVLSFNGTKDKIVRYDGKTGYFLGYKVQCQKLEQSLELWATKDRCTRESVEFDGDIQKQVFTGGVGGSEVCMYLFPGKHVWPGGGNLLPICGFSYKERHATDIMWDFFEKHPKVITVCDSTTDAVRTH